MSKLLYIGFGGFLGSISRYLVSGLTHKIFENTNFPIGTLAVNIIGCLLIGFLGGLAERNQIFSPEFRLLLFVGFLGGFTTFSTFGYEVISFARDGQLLSATLNIFVHLIFAVGAVWLGLTVSRLIPG